METIYALVIILSGTLLPSDDAGPDVLSGEVENRTTIYFRTLEACEASYAEALASKERMVPAESDAQVEIKPCEGIQVAQ